MSESHFPTRRLRQLGFHRLAVWDGDIIVFRSVEHSERIRACRAEYEELRTVGMNRHSIKVVDLLVVRFVGL